MMKRLFSSAIALSCIVAALGADIYVSPSGSNGADGSRESPVRSIDEAVRRAREMRRLHRADPSDTLRIVLEEGTYQLTAPLFIRPEDSGTPTGPTLVCSAPGARRAVVSGGVKVTGWTKGVSDSRFPESARQNIWVAEAPRVNGRIVETRQLWADGRKMQRAWQFAPETMQRMVDFDAAGRTITIPEPGIRDLNPSDGLEMVVHQRWAIAILRVKDMVPDGKGNVRVSFHDPESRLEFEHPWPQPVIGGERGNSSFALTGSPALLDSPGEWWQEYPSGKIYFYPKEGVDPNAADVVVPALETLMTVQGSRERTVGNITFRNLAFEYSSWLRPSLEGHVTLQGGFRLLDAYKLKEPGLPEKAELENQA